MKKNILEEALRKQIREILSEEVMLQEINAKDALKRAAIERAAIEQDKSREVNDLSDSSKGMAKIQINNRLELYKKKFKKTQEEADKTTVLPLLKAIVKKLVELEYFRRLNAPEQSGLATKITKLLYKVKGEIKKLHDPAISIKSNISPKDSTNWPAAKPWPPRKLSRPKSRWKKCSFDSRGGVKYGCYGDEVGYLQVYLNFILKRYVSNYKPLKEDRHFGRKTLQALKKASKLPGFPDVSGNYVDKTRIKAIDAFWNKIIQSDRIINKMIQPKKQRPAAPKKSAIDRAMDKDREDIRDIMGESKFSNDKELQNLMESFKKFTRND